MAQHPIILGQYPGDKKGDPARVAGAKLNLDIGELYALVASLNGLTLVAGPVTKLAPGANPTAVLTGAAPNYTLNLGLPEGAAGAGAPNSADILAIAEKDRLERALAAAGVPDEPSLILDFVRGVHFAKKSAIAASVLTLITDLGGVSVFTRASTATYWDSDGLLKTAANNVPRLEYDPVTRLPRGLLIENEVRTNGIINNVSLSSSSPTSATRTANASASPDGAVTMSRFTSTVNGGSNTVMTDMVVTVPNDTVTRTFSAFLRQGTSPSSIVNFYYGGGTYIAVFATIDWATKTISGNGNPKLVDCGGGLYRASVSLANNSSGNTQAVCRVYVRDGNNNVLGEYVDTGTWQIEAGAAMSSPIITGASAVTRAGDVLSIAAAQWLNASAMSALVEFDLNQARSDGGVTNPIHVTNHTGSDLQLREGSVIGGVDFYTQIPASAPIDTGSYATTIATPMRLAIGVDATGYGYAKDNSITFSGGAATYPPDMNRMHIGSANFMGHIRRVIVWPQRLSNTKVQALSNQAAWS